MRKNFKKLKKKSDPSSIRFDIVHLEFIRQKEPLLRTSQEVVDFLLKAYFERYKVQPKSPFVEDRVEEPKKEVDGEYKSIFAPSIKNIAAKTVQQWIAEKREIEVEEDFVVFQQKLDAASYLSDRQKKEIRLA